MPYGRIVAASKATGWTDWTQVFDGSGLNAYGEVLVDRARVTSEGVLSILSRQNSSRWRALRGAVCVTSQWNGAFQASVTVTNTGTATLNGWSLAFSFPAGHHAWSSAAPGLIASWSGSSPAPTAFTLNGQPCSLG
jgi:hypothetical protein